MSADAESRPARSPLRWLVYALVAYVAASLLVGVVYTFKQVLRRPQWPVRSTPRDLAMRAREVGFETADGYSLKGVFAPPVDAAPVIILQHGRGRTRDDVLPYGRLFARAGYGVLSFDWRGHGLSDGYLIQHGGGEAADIRAALAFLAARPDVGDRDVALMGFSLGAACLAVSAPVTTPAVRCMVLDSPYGDLGRMANRRLAILGPLAFGPRLVLDGVGALLFGARVRDIRPEAALAAFAPRPVFLTHGVTDTVIPVAESHALKAAYPGPVEYWETEIPGHCTSRAKDTRAWVGKIAAFLGENLKGAPPAAAVLALTPETLPSGTKVFRDRHEARQASGLPARTPPRDPPVPAAAGAGATP